jgi:hypothetical protein
VKNLPKQLAAMTFVGCAMLMTNIQPASAFPGWKTTELGTTTSTDNVKYFKKFGGFSGTPVPPRDLNALCRWRFENKNAKGQSKPNYETRCYVSYWSWW